MATSQKLVALGRTLKSLGERPWMLTVLTRPADISARMPALGRLLASSSHTTGGFEPVDSITSLIVFTSQFYRVRAVGILDDHQPLARNVLVFLPAEDSIGVATRWLHGDSLFASTILEAEVGTGVLLTVSQSLTRSLAAH